MSFYFGSYHVFFSILILLSICLLIIVFIWANEIGAKLLLSTPTSYCQNRDFVGMVNRRKRDKEEGDPIEKYDVVYVPTQGGFHYSIVYDILDNETAVCYPITTASGTNIRMLGNKWHTLQDCGCPEFNGYRLTSAAAYVDMERASYSKKGHISNFSEIEMAVSRF